MKIAALWILAALFVAGCGSSQDSGAPKSDRASVGTPQQAGTTTTGDSGDTPTAAQAVKVSITPGNGLTQRPDRGITVRSSGAPLKRVVVRSGGDTVAGTFNKPRTVWHSKWALGVAKRYTVAATAGTVTKHRTIRTFTPQSTFAPRTIMADDTTYGVGMPLIIYFDQPVKDRKAVERALEVRTSKPVVGSWYWDDQCGLVPECLYFRPQHYWKQHTTVHFTMHMNGVRAAPGVFGTQNLSRTIQIGESVRVVASTETHHMTVYRGGKVFAKWPISTGKPGDDTANGNYLTIEKANPVEMKGDDYDLIVPYSVRITWSGAYLHAASWSVGSQGAANVSHGCINMSPENAATFYEMAVPGDPVTVVGSPVAGRWDNGWTMWFKSWSEWKRGSALKQAVYAGPKGSHFIEN